MHKFFFSNEWPQNFTPILADFGAVTPEGETLRLGTSGYTDPSIMNNGNSKL